MGRSEQKAKERKAAQQRSLVTPTPSETPAPVRRGRDLRRGGGVREREPFEMPQFLQPRPIATPTQGNRPAPTKAKQQNTGATAKPPVSRGRNLPPSAAVPGTGPESNTVGSDADPNTPGLQGPGAPGARINANGLVSYGKDLSSLNAFTKAFTGGYEIADVKTAFQSEDLPGAYQNGSNSISTGDTKYKLPEGGAPSPLNGGLAGANDLTIQDSTYEIGSESVPGTLGRSGDAQEGSSDKPDIAEGVRTIRMHRNKRDQLEGFSTPEPLGGPSETKGNGMNAKRREIRSAFLDMDTPIIQASVKANAIANYGKDSDGNARFNYGGELVYAKDGMQQQAKNAAMMGMNPSQFLDIPTTPDVQPDAPANNELNPAFAQVKPEADAFFKKKMNAVKGANK